MRKFVQGVVEIRSLKFRTAEGARSRGEQRAKSRELETPRVSVIGYPFSVIRSTRERRNTGPVAAGHGERRLSVISYPITIRSTSTSTSLN